MLPDLFHSSHTSVLRLPSLFAAAWGKPIAKHFRCPSSLFRNTQDEPEHLCPVYRFFLSTRSSSLALKHLQVSSTLNNQPPNSLPSTHTHLQLLLTVQWPRGPRWHLQHSSWAPNPHPQPPAWCFLWCHVHNNTHGLLPIFYASKNGLRGLPITVSVTTTMACPRSPREI